MERFSNLEEEVQETQADEQQQQQQQHQTDKNERMENVKEAIDKQDYTPDSNNTNNSNKMHPKDTCTSCGDADSCAKFAVDNNEEKKNTDSSSISNSDSDKAEQSVDTNKQAQIEADEENVNKNKFAHYFPKQDVSTEDNPLVNTKDKHDENGGGYPWVPRRTLENVVISDYDPDDLIYIPSDLLELSQLRGEGDYCYFPLHDILIEKPGEIINQLSGKTFNWLCEEYESVKRAFYHKVKARYALREVDMVVANKSLVDAFKQKQRQSLPCSDIHIVFHGTDSSNIRCIFNEGFMCKGTLDSGYYGAGFYFTHYPEYAAHYIRNLRRADVSCGWKQLQVGAEATIILCYILPGSMWQVDCMNYKGKPCLDGDCRQVGGSHDSHYVRVKKQTKPEFKKKYDLPEEDFYPADPNDELQDTFDEIVIFETERCLPRYALTFKRVCEDQTTVVWYDQNIYSVENRIMVNHLTQRFNLLVYDTMCVDAACEFIKENSQERKSSLRVVTAGKGGEEFVRSVREVYDGCILVYCMDVDFHRSWSQKFGNIMVTDDTDEALQFCTTKGEERESDQKHDEKKEGKDKSSGAVPDKQTDEQTQAAAGKKDKESETKKELKVEKDKGGEEKSKQGVAAKDGDETKATQQVIKHKTDTHNSNTESSAVPVKQTQ